MNSLTKLLGEEGGIQKLECRSKYWPMIAVMKYKIYKDHCHEYLMHLLFADIMSMSDFLDCQECVGKIIIKAYGKETNKSYDEDDMKLFWYFLTMDYSHYQLMCEYYRSIGVFEYDYIDPVCANIYSCFFNERDFNELKNNIRCRLTPGELVENYDDNLMVGFINPKRKLIKKLLIYHEGNVFE